MEQQTQQENAGAANRDARLEAIEQSLIERIADVDDDRRRTASALQRALETRVEEMDAKLRRSRRMTATFAALAFLIALVALGFLQMQRVIDIPEITGQLAQLEQDVARVSAVNSEDGLLREKLSGLTAAVADVTASLKMFELERSERKAADAHLAERLTQSEATSDRMASEIEVLSAALAGASPSSGIAPGSEPERSSQPSAQPEAGIVEPPLPRSATPGIESEQPSDDQTVAPTSLETEVDGAELVGTIASDTGGVSTPAAEESASGDPGISLASEPQISIPAAVEPRPVDAGKPGQDAARVWTIKESGLTLPEQRYALQLIGFYSLDALLEFADRDDLPSQLYYRRETLRGKPWYALIHSLHENTTSVAAARATLPPDLADLDLWVRPLSEGTKLEVFEFIGSAP
jgi:DamX protein